MVGPFMQGILLMGIIYWYSKSMMSMINDYYRSEFQRKIQAASASKPAEETPLNVDNFMDYVRELDTKHLPDQQTVDNELNGTLEPQPQLIYSHIMLRFMQITGVFRTLDICRAADSSIS
ncbi:hypothetical protein ACLKA7_009784 [Drosophila subpalustris]